MSWGLWQGLTHLLPRGTPRGSGARLCCERAQGGAVWEGGWQDSGGVGGKDRGSGWEQARHGGLGRGAGEAGGAVGKPQPRP